MSVEPVGAPPGADAMDLDDDDTAEVLYSAVKTQPGLRAVRKVTQLEVGPDGVSLEHLEHFEFPEYI